jgi:hypothetical protein
MAEVKAWVWSGNAAKLLADNILVGATTVSATELGYLSGVTSAIQTQLNGKEPTINLTINRAVISDGSGGLTVSATTATEVGYLSGVTSAIQTQLDGKEPTISLTGNRAVVSDAGGALTVSSATDTEVGYLSGVTSAIQTQIDSKTGIADNETITGTWIFNNLITFSGEVSTDAAHLGGYGLLPVGAIVAYNPGYYTNGSNGGFAISGPAGNSRAQVNAFLNGKGWYVCDGAALNNAASPIWNAAGRYLPNLDDSRFLMGSTAAGASGGASSVTLSSANIPTLSVSGSTGTGTTGFNGSHQHTMAHTHSISHNHAIQDTSTIGDHSHAQYVTAGIPGPGVRTDYNGDASSSAFPQGINTGNAGGHKHTVDLPSISATSGPASNSTTTLEGSHNHSIPSLSVSASYTNASPTSFSVLPTYLSTFFIVRAF